MNKDRKMKLILIYLAMYAIGNITGLLLMNNPMAGLVFITICIAIFMYIYNK